MGRYDEIKQELRELIQEQDRSTDTVVSYGIIKILGNRQALVWRRVLALALYEFQDVSYYKSWFLCGGSLIEEAIGENQSYVSRVLISLEKQDLIVRKIKKTNSGSERWVRVLWKAAIQLERQGVALEQERETKHYEVREGRTLSEFGKKVAPLWHDPAGAEVTENSKNRHSCQSSGSSSTAPSKSPVSGAEPPETRRLATTPGGWCPHYKNISNKKIRMTAPPLGGGGSPSTKTKTKTTEPSKAVPPATLGIVQSSTELSEYEQLAELLKETIRRSPEVGHPSWSVKKQVAHLRRIARSKTRKDGHLLQEVLVWYCENFADRKKLRLPTIHSCSQFLKHWDWVRARYGATAELQKTIKLPKELKQPYESIWCNVTNFIWRKDALEILPGYIKKSILDFQRVGLVIWDLDVVQVRPAPKDWIEQAENEALQRWVDVLVNEVGYTRCISPFLSFYWEQVFWKTYYRTNWDGNLEHYAFTPRCSELYQLFITTAGFYNFGKPEVEWLYERIEQGCESPK